MNWAEAEEKLREKKLPAAADWLRQIGLRNVNYTHSPSRNLIAFIENAFSWSEEERSTPGSFGYWAALVHALSNYRTLDSETIRVFANLSSFAVLYALYLEKRRHPLIFNPVKILKDIQEYLQISTTAQEFFSGDSLGKT